MECLVVVELGLLHDPLVDLGVREVGVDPRVSGGAAADAPGHHADLGVEVVDKWTARIALPEIYSKNSLSTKKCNVICFL